mgnify:CR=1 FL=1
MKIMSVDNAAMVVPAEGNDLKFEIREIASFNDVYISHLFVL